MVKSYFIDQISWKCQWCNGKNVNGVTAYKLVFQQKLNDINQLCIVKSLHKHFITVNNHI